MQRVVRKSPSLQHIFVRFNLAVILPLGWTPGGELILPLGLENLQVELY